VKIHREPGFGDNIPETFHDDIAVADRLAVHDALAGVDRIMKVFNRGRRFAASFSQLLRIPPIAENADAVESAGFSRPRWATNSL